LALSLEIDNFIACMVVALSFGGTRKCHTISKAYKMMLSASASLASRVVKTHVGIEAKLL